MNAADRSTQLDAAITTAFNDLRHTITDDYRDLESSTFARVVTAVTDPEPDERPDVHTATLVVGGTLAAWFAITGDPAAAAFLAILGAAGVAAIRHAARRNPGPRPPRGERLGGRGH